MQHHAWGSLLPRPQRLRAVLALLLATMLATLVAAPSVALTGDEDDLGARALRGTTWSTPVLGAGDQTRSGPVYPQSPPVSTVYNVEPSYYTDDCHVRPRQDQLKQGCVYGDPSSTVEVALLGDSKVGRYFPALEEIARREGWALRPYTKSACAFVDEPAPSYPACDTYNARLRQHLAANPPDIVITGSKRPDVADGYTRTWTWLRGLGVDHVVALWDSPLPEGTHPAECVADALVAGRDLRTCAVELPDATTGNPSMRQAAEAVDIASFVDLRDWVCPGSALSPRCAPVIGRAQVYGLGAHLATTYAATLTDPIHQRLHEIGVAAYRPSVDRVAGADRYETAALLSRDTAPGGRVFLASGQNYPDALAAAAKARAGAGTDVVLLTRQDRLPAPTRTALTRLRPSEVIVVGGPSVVSGAVLTSVRSLELTARRVYGSDRYDTAARIARLAPVTGGGTVYAVTGDGYADALAAAAQAGRQGSPLLLVRQGGVPLQTAEELRRLAPQRIVVVGGPVSISEDVVGDLGDFAPVVERIGGADRYATAALLADGAPGGGTVHVSVGTAFPDALAAAAVAETAVLLVRPTRVPAVTADALAALAPERAVLTGGTNAARPAVHRALIRLVR